MEMVYLLSGWMLQELSAGEHKVSVTAEGIPDGEASFTVK